MPYGYEACVAEMSRKFSKGNPTDFFHEIDLILGLVINSQVADMVLKRLVSAINLKEASTSHISDGKSKAQMENKRGQSTKWKKTRGIPL